MTSLRPSLLFEGLGGAVLSQAAALMHVSNTEQWLREHLRNTDPQQEGSSPTPEPTAP